MSTIHDDIGSTDIGGLKDFKPDMSDFSSERKDALWNNINIHIQSPAPSKPIFHKSLTFKFIVYGTIIIIIGIIVFLFIPRKNVSTKPEIKKVNYENIKRENILIPSLNNVKYKRLNELSQTIKKDTLRKDYVTKVKKQSKDSKDTSTIVTLPVKLEVVDTSIVFKYQHECHKVERRHPADKNKHGRRQVVV